MKDSLLDIKKINGVLTRTIDTIENGRQELIEISEHARNEYKKIEGDLKKVRNRVQKIIKWVDILEVEERKSRSKLASVSKKFDIYSETEIKKAYDKANDLRIKLMVKRQEEKVLLEKRAELEVRLNQSLKVLRRAEKINKQVGVAMQYLKGNLDDILVTVDDLSKRQFLGVKIIEAQEEERQRLARDIHDGPAQSMANIVIKSELCQRLLKLDSGKIKEELKNLNSIVRNTLKDIRKIIYDLRPMSLDDLGLVPTLERYVCKFMEDSKIKVKLNIMGNVNNIQPVIEIAVFRVVQEALSNIRKHSKASEVSIIIESTLNRLNVVVSDNGIGFDLNQTSNHRDIITGGFGIMSMRERIELLDGKFQIKSSPGMGTKVYLFIPIKKEEDVYEK